MKLARVSQIHPESNAVDVVLVRDGRRIAGVHVMAHSAGGDMGLVDLSQPTNTGYGARLSGQRDIYALVDWVDSMPVVIGFVYPEIAQCLFTDLQRMIYRHASDAYVTLDGDANIEVAHPSGTYLRIGTTPAHDDLTGKDYNGLWKIANNTGSAVHVQLTVMNAGKQVAALHVDPSGNVELTHSGNLTVQTAGNLQASAGGTTAVQSQGALTVTAPTITLNGHVVVNGKLDASGDVTGGDISLQQHTHGGVQAGNSSTGPSQ